MSKVVPPRQEAFEEDGFRYVRSQKLPDSLLAGASPVYQMRQQLKRFVPDADYVKDPVRSDDVFDVFKVPVSAFRKMEKGLQDEANSRVTRSDSGLKTAPGTTALDKITQDKQTLDQLAGELPVSID